MRHNWDETTLGNLVEDLTLERLVNVAPDDVVIDPTITSKTHTIGISSEQMGASVKITKRVRLIPGDLVFSRLHTQNGAFAYSNMNFLATTTFIPLKVHENVVDKKFLFWALHVRVPSLSSSHSVGRETYKTRDILELPIPLPKLDEQRHIVEYIEALTSRITKVLSLRTAAIEESNLLIYSKTNQLFKDLENYPKAFLGNLGKNGSNPIQTGPFGSQLLSSEFVDSGIPVLNVGNVQPEGLKMKRLDHVTPEKAETLSRYSLLEDDLLFARTGATLGKVCLLPKGCDGWLMTGHLFRVRFDATRCNPRYAFVALRGADSVRSQIFGQVRGATRPGFNTTLLSQVEIPLPPLDEQRRIVAYLDSVQARLASLRELQSATGGELSALLPSVLDRAFKGEL